MTHANEKTDMIYQNLIDAGCDKQTTDKCMSIVSRGEYLKILPILSRQKVNLLDTVHFVQKQIDCLDYLIYKINREHI